ncbi:MAG TPA: helix-turn-helix transcriptional regulator [Solirubrobacteraceae bacterium]|jgi:DNA-binding PadR family transcriptional regulator|nr:helix-turn-helix transcriptional regulator [Solirubrobacteraceae bacterium]
MSATRLLVLGAVRIFQPVHGYFVRRELLSWHAEHWAHLNPGSVYNALRSLTREGYLEEAGTETEGGRPARTTYRLTSDGEAEFLALLRAALWNIEPFEPAMLLAAWSFSWLLRRAEVTEALEHRLEQIAAAGRASAYAIEDLARDPEKPAHVAEHLRLVQARLEGEAGWVRGTLERLRSGDYWFDGEPGPPRRTRSDGVGSARSGTA